MGKPARLPGLGASSSLRPTGQKRPQEGSLGNARSVHTTALLCSLNPPFHSPFSIPCLNFPSPDLVVILPCALARDKLQLQQHFRWETIHPGINNKQQYRKCWVHMDVLLFWG